MASETNNTKLIIRIVIFAILAVVVVLAVMDYRAKSAATTTANAWLDLVEQDGGLYEKHLEEHIEGVPNLDKATTAFDETFSYTWSGIFRDYRVDVVLQALSNDGERMVMSVNGPIND